MRNLFLLSVMSTLGLLAAAAPAPEARWWRGNTHTHTLWSDGDAPPEMVAAWYKSNGYHFLVLSDHNVVAQAEKWRKVGKEKGEVSPQVVARLKDRAVLRERDGVQEMRLRPLAEVRQEHEEAGRFIMIPGEEISDGVLEAGVRKPIHHNSMNHTHLIPPAGGSTVREVLERTIAAVEAESKRSGKPVLVHLNHPNFHWGVTADDIAHVKGERFFEVYNGHRGVRNHGDAEHRSTEAIWDYVLALRLGKLGGPPLYGLATDDAHNYHQDRAQAVSSTGRGWIWVRAETLTPDAIVQALMAGDFYASSGVKLASIVRGPGVLSVQVEAEPGVTYKTRFIGTRKGSEKIGEVLQETAGVEASYRLKGDELYVRAVVVSDRHHPNPYAPEDMESAWIQPLVP
ncbi:MAG TPA: histidinol-phosphatase [Planctomycetota bacterium]|nr:histidinol-phosphatase [Planctomycetota bacterium]